MEEILKKAGEFKKVCDIRASAHFKMSQQFARYHLALGIPVTVLTAVVATTIFTTLADNKAILWLALATGVISVLAAVLSALQTFLRYSELAADHRSAAVSYEGIRHAIDIFELRYGKDADFKEALDKLEEISAKVDATVAAAPTIPLDVYRESAARHYPHTAEAAAA